MSDVFFARLLKDSHCLSWYKDYNRKSTNRDIEYRLLIPSDYLLGEIINPGLYPVYCVEIEINLLALNTIAKSDELKNIDTEASRYY